MLDCSPQVWGNFIYLCLSLRNLDKCSHTCYFFWTIWLCFKLKSFGPTYIAIQYLVSSCDMSQHSKKRKTPILIGSRFVLPIYIKIFFWTNLSGCDYCQHIVISNLIYIMSCISHKSITECEYIVWNKNLLWYVNCA